MVPPINFILAVIYVLKLFKSRRERLKQEKFKLLNTVMLSLVRLLPILLKLLLLFKRRDEGQVRKLKRPTINTLIRFIQGYRKDVYHNDFWRYLESNWNYFYWLTGELPETLEPLVRELRNVQIIDRRGRKTAISFRNQVLLTLIWLRRYPTMHHISTHFGITTSSVHRFIHKILRLMHVYVVPRYIRLHSMNTWNQLQGYFEHWPKVVAVVDGTPFRISKPKGLIQRLFWRKDRHCFFMNWIVISDVQGFIVFSRPGFIGHLHDSTCYRHLQIPPLPQGLQIMADKGFQNRRPILIPQGRQGQRMRGIMELSARTSIERVFGILKSSYQSVGTRRFRSRRHIGPITCNVTAAMHNRRLIIFKMIRNQLG